MAPVTKSSRRKLCCSNAIRAFLTNFLNFAEIDDFDEFENSVVLR